MKPELLMPAGDMEKLKTAFQYGADAVYAGVPMFSLRARENQFNIQSVKEAVDYTKSLGKKIYLTVNIFPHNYKLPALKNALRPLAELKPDAFIMADPGVIMLSREIAPEIPVHLSVQANNVNWASARFWHKQGIERVILSREISLNEIKGIHEMNPSLELEFFVHGSICMAYSGRCLLSNYFTYRDANQGTCAHSCRWEYKVHKSHSKYEVDPAEAENRGYKALDGDYYLEEVNRPGQFMQIDEDEHGSYIMNSRDNCLIEYLKELKDAGICSFKVEGRNKTVFYVATVAKTYRQAIEDVEYGKPFNPDYIKELAKTSNRGFIPGFLMANPREKAQEYEKNITHQTHEFIGIIKGIYDRDKVLIPAQRPSEEGERAKNEVVPPLTESESASLPNNRKLYELEVKGRFDAPGKCELFSPTQSLEWTLEKIYTMRGEPLTVIHPGQRENVLIELPEDTCIGAMLRKERERKAAIPVKTEIQGKESTVS